MDIETPQPVEDQASDDDILNPFDDSKQLISKNLPFDEPEDPEPPVLMRLEREDLVYTKKHNKYIRLDTDIIMEKKQSDEDLLKIEASEVFVSRKMRHELLNQYLKKIRWRLTNDRRVESNSRLVAWEDGTFGMYVGSEYYELAGESPPNQMLYTVTDDTMLLQSRVAFTSRLRNFKFKHRR